MQIAKKKPAAPKTKAAATTSFSAPDVSGALKDAEEALATKPVAKQKVDIMRLIKWSDCGC